MIGPNDVTVTIFGREYTLRSATDHAYMVELARIVDDKMREAAQGGEPSALKAAVLAALNLADDLHRERDLRCRLDDRTDRIVKLLAEEVGKVPADGVS